MDNLIRFHSFEEFKKMLPVGVLINTYETPALEEFYESLWVQAMKLEDGTPTEEGYYMDISDISRLLSLVTDRNLHWRYEK